MSRSSFVKSTLILSAATLLSKVLGSVFRIPLQNIAGDEVLGIFSIVYPVYMVALILSVAGIPIAISKLIAEARAKNESEHIRQIYFTASILAILFGIISFTLIYSFSSSIATALGGPNTRLALIVVAATLLVAPYMAVYRGFFQGFEDMRPTAVSQVIEQFIRVGLILFVAYYLVNQGYSDDIIAGGVMAGSIIGALFSLLYLRITYVRSPFKLSSGGTYSYRTFSIWSINILKVSIPIAIGTITMALLNFVDSITIPYSLESAGIKTSDITYLYGIYGRGLSLVQIATVLATSIVLPLIPLITTKLTAKEHDETRAIIEKTHRITHLTSWPAALGLLALTLPLNLALFTNTAGSSTLAILGLSSVFTSLVVLGTGILQGMNLAKQAAMVIVVGVVLKTIANIYLIDLFGLMGAALSTLVVYIILFVINSYYISKQLTSKIVTIETGKIVFSSLTMAAIIGIPTLFINFTDWSRLQALAYAVIAILFGTGFYFIQLYLMRVINKHTIRGIRSK
ncbi:polysaccharide biosynthesis/transport protein [Virgibacillus phasianinus]|uniref:Polysaccharide biosynthesis/transport protein n=1 Tax=Virgibacillus phasianinus TaxID=2017483 RepID=A0A220U1Z8_9BACI|nr:polysaccharide biosynthesis protein [Virgibacillus phasianinus]ASK62139.1 polysaccharide biosynthesis/transport protein [Virgibacillus phasianinus]